MGTVLWQTDDDVACEFWVSADDRLILYRPADAAPVTVHRAGRHLDVPAEKPVVLRDQDQVDVGGKRLRLHVHGQASAVTAPVPVEPRTRSLGRAVRRAAAAVAIGSAVLAAGCGDKKDDAQDDPPIDVRDQPPVVAPPKPAPTPEQPPEDPATPTEQKAEPVIEVRGFPPDVDESNLLPAPPAE